MSFKRGLSLRQKPASLPGYFHPRSEDIMKVIPHAITNYLVHYYKVKCMTAANRRHQYHLDQYPVDSKTPRQSSCILEPPGDLFVCTVLWNQHDSAKAPPWGCNSDLDVLGSRGRFALRIPTPPAHQQQSSGPPVIL